MTPGHGKYAQKLLQWGNPEHMNTLIQSLEENKPSISSTDTILGFLGSISPSSVQAIKKLKGREESKPFIILIGSADKVNHFANPANITPDIKRLISHCWPGPVTILFQAKAGIPDYLTGPNGTIALRCPNHAGLLSILGHFEGLVSTSVNKAGQPPAQKVDDINEELMNGCEYVVIDQDLGHTSPLASTIIDLSCVAIAKPDASQVHSRPNPSIQFPPSGAKSLGTDGAHTAEGEIRIVREGAYSIEKLEQIYGKPFIR